MTNPYSSLPASGPYAPVIGAALITMVEPHPGHDLAYNRWYEDDHFIAGAMAMPWMFSGRRWVATTRLQRLRYPSDSAVAQPLDAGKYISTYWITDGRYEDHLLWTVATNQRLLPDGRVFQDRTHVYTSFQRYRGAWYATAEGPRDIHSLEYPFRGLVVEVVDAAPGGRDALVAARLTDPPETGAAMCLLFEPMPLPADRMSYVKEVEGVDRRITALWFTEGDPADNWDGFAGLGPWAASVGARVELVAPFIPTIPGTNRYVDELR